MKFISPMKVLASKRKMLRLNLNEYRNTHYRILNNAKINYKEVMKKQIEKAKRLEEKCLPEDIDYLSIQGLRLEARQKLDKIRPKNLGQAGRISGVSPADIAVLMVYLSK